MKSYVPNTERERQEMLSAIGLKDMMDLYVDVPSEMLLQSLDLPVPSTQTLSHGGGRVDALARHTAA